MGIGHCRYCGLVKAHVQLVFITTGSHSANTNQIDTDSREAFSSRPAYDGYPPWRRWHIQYAFMVVYELVRLKPVQRCVRPIRWPE